MESYLWNTGAIVIVIVNDMVEFATLGRTQQWREYDINGKNEKIGMDGRNGDE